MNMRKLRHLLIAGGLALAGTAAATPALADVGFSLNFGPPAYYYAPPPPPPYYYYGGTYLYLD
jgi:hypothetical protein